MSIESYPSETHRFFVFDSEERDQYYFDSKEERDRFALERINEYTEDGEWLESCVMGIIVGEVTHLVKQVDIEEKTPDGEIDDDGFDEYSEYWDADWNGTKIICNYKPIEIAKFERA